MTGCLGLGIRKPVREVQNLPKKMNAAAPSSRGALHVGSVATTGVLLHQCLRVFSDGTPTSRCWHFHVFSGFPTRAKDPQTNQEILAKKPAPGSPDVLSVFL